MTVLSLSWDGMNSGENIVHQVLSSSSSDSIVSNNNNNNINPVASVATATAAATAAATATPPIATTTDPSKHSELLTAAANDFNYFMGVDGILERSSLSFPDELKILSILIVIFLFLLFLIMLLWDRYGKEIGQLYTPNGIILTTKHHARGQEEMTTTTNVHDVADEYSIYQKLPTFFYEYAHGSKKKKQ